MLLRDFLDLLLHGNVGRVGSVQLVVHLDIHGLAIRGNGHFGYRHDFAVALVGLFDRIADALERDAGGTGIADIRDILAVAFRGIGLSGRSAVTEGIATALIGEQQGIGGGDIRFFIVPGTGSGVCARWSLGDSFVMVRAANRASGGVSIVGPGDGHGIAVIRHGASRLADILAGLLRGHLHVLVVHYFHRQRVPIGIAADLLELSVGFDVDRRIARFALVHAVLEEINVRLLG